MKTIVFAILHTLLFYQIFSLCTNGLNNCINCRNGNECSQCSSMYGFINLTVPLGSIIIECQPCSQLNCLECINNYTSCSTCNQRYRLTSSGGFDVCQPCTDPNCQICNPGPNHCQSCSYGSALSPSNQCVPCLVNMCAFCNSNISTCDGCYLGYGLNTSTSCLPCLATNCTSCGSDYSDCYQCDTGFGVKNVAGRGVCQPCDDVLCIICSFNYIDCTKCQTGFGVETSTGTCKPCSDNNCLTCSQLNFRICYSCIQYYGLNSNNMCVPCSNAYCLNCSNNYQNCVQCWPGRGLSNGQFTNSCPVCYSLCADCLGTNNYACTSCVNGYYLNNLTCQICPSFCLQCTSNTICDLCQTNYFVNTNSSCQLCPTNCLQCYLPGGASLPDCTVCQTDYLLTRGASVTCEEPCGDFIVVTGPCDNGIGIQYDGCTDNCQIQSGFQCIINSANRSICSYQNVTQIQIISIQKAQFSNSFKARLKVWPPLYVLKTSDLNGIFVINNPIFNVKKVQFDLLTNQILMEVQYSQDFFDQDLVIQFVPDQNKDERYFASINSTAIMRVKLKYYPEPTLKMSQASYYLSFMISALGMLAMVIGLVSKRLAGIQAMFVYQFSWISMIWINAYLHMSFLAVEPLRYTTGYHHKFFSSQTSKRLLQYEYPHTKQFSIDQTIFANNINIFLLFQLIPLLISIIMMIIVKVLDIKKKKYQKQKKYQATTQIRKNYGRALAIKQVMVQCLMYFGLLNLINFTACCYLFFSNGVSSLHLVSLIFLALGGVAYLLTALIFCCDPDPFDYFRYAFRKRQPAMAFYYVYPVMIAGSVVLIAMLPEQTWACLIPLALMLPYILIYRPYSEQKQNYRSAFNIVVIIIVLSLRVLLQYSPGSVSQSFIYNFINIFLLIAVLIVSYVSLIYNLIYKYCLKEKQEKNQQQKVMCQLELINIKSQMRGEDSIFKNILPEKVGVLQFSNVVATSTNNYPKNNSIGKLNNTLLQQSQNIDSPRHKALLSPSSRIKNELQAERINKPNYEQLTKAAEQKKTFINELRQKMMGGTTELTEQQIRANNQLICAMDILVNQNQFLRLKYANDFTDKLMNDQRAEQGVLGIIKDNQIQQGQLGLKDQGNQEKGKELKQIKQAKSSQQLDKPKQPKSIYIEYYNLI